MDIPWQFFGTLSAASAIAILLAVYLGRKVVDLLESRVSRPFESSLTKAEGLYAKQVDLGAQVDLDLRNKREEPYRKLWLLTGLLPMWPRADDVTYAKLAELSGELRDWYFTTGGLYLSTEARAVYGKVQEALNSRPRGSGDAVITDDEYDRLRAQCSLLRTKLTEDLLSRTRLPDLP
jgi:hypothetical protein